MSRLTLRIDTFVDLTNHGGRLLLLPDSDNGEPASLLRSKDFGVMITKGLRN